MTPYSTGHWFGIIFYVVMFLIGFVVGFTLNKLNKEVKENE